MHDLTSVQLSPITRVKIGINHSSKCGANMLFMLQIDLNTHIVRVSLTLKGTLFNTSYTYIVKCFTLLLNYLKT